MCTPNLHDVNLLLAAVERNSSLAGALIDFRHREPSLQLNGFFKWRGSRDT